MKISIFGAGSWGCAIANVISNNNPEAKIFCYIRSINKIKKNSSLLKLSNKENIIITDKVTELKNSDLIFIGVQARYFRFACESLSDVVTDQPVVSLSKGIEKDSLMLMTEIIEEVLKTKKSLALSGANFAFEIMENKPSISVLASKNEDSKDSVKKIIESNFFQIKTSSDTTGVQVCGAVKNIIGIANGYFLTQNECKNLQSALFVSGTKELCKSISIFQGDIQTAYSHCGIGDLFLSCCSIDSRNTALGSNIKKYGIEKALEIYGKIFPEGYYSSYSLSQKLKKEKITNKEMPICSFVYNLLHKHPSQEVNFFEICL